MPTKLNKDIRGKICEAIISQRFDAEIAEAGNRLSTAAETVYLRKYSEDHLELMASIPKGWTYESTTFYAVIAGDYTSLSLPSPRKFPYENRHSALVSLPGTNPVAKQYDEARIRMKDLRQRIAEARLEVMSVLNKCTTDQALLDRWPESKKIVEKVIRTIPKVEKFPAVSITDLNKKMNLPPKGKK